MSTIRNIAKKVIDQGQSSVYHYEQNQEAKRVLKIVEAEKGKLDSKIKKTCKEYALDVFGNEIYAPWLLTYSSYYNEFKEGWIPDNFYGEIVVPTLKGDYGRTGDRSAIITKIIKESDSLDLCYYINHLFINSDYEVLNEEKLRSTLFSNHSKVVFKIEYSIQGKGVYFFDENSFDINEIKKLGNGVFQKYIEQHPFYSKFHDKSVATIRLTSVSKINGETEVRAGYFRFGSGNDTHVISKSQMRIPIDVKTGQLFDTAFFANTESTKSLPNNDIDFAGLVLPSFDDCKTEVEKMHSRIPFVRSIGWDIIVDKENKVRLIEMNGRHNGITFTEMIQGPTFNDLGWENLKNN